jgi:hypothetical protein
MTGSMEGKWILTNPIADDGRTPSLSRPPVFVMIGSGYA